MADEIAKFLAKVTKAENIFLSDLIGAIIANAATNRDSKKLAGSKDIFRVRKGKFRIIYRKTGNECTILSVSHRSEKTYRDF